MLSTEDGSAGVKGRVTVPLEAALRERPLGSPVKLYACGPTPMMRACAQLAAVHGRACDVSLEQVMGCGLGGCYSCVISVRSGNRTRFVRSCIGGPVFDGADIAWD